MGVTWIAKKAAIAHDRRHRQPRIVRADEEGQKAGVPEEAAFDVEVIKDEHGIGGERDDPDRQRRSPYHGSLDRPALGQPCGELCRADARRVMPDPSGAAGKHASG